MDNNKGVEEKTFQNQKTILSAHFGSDCKYIDSYAFNGCSSLIEINKDNSITEIKDNAFSGTGILHATFKELKSIGESAFQGCENLESIDISNCQTIESSAFQDCKNLKSVDISFCNTIGSNAFNACENISQISLFNCKQISDGAFFNCNNLKKVYIYSDNCELGDKNVFKEKEGSIIDGIVFYFKPDIYIKYLEEDKLSNSWKPYKEHMVTMADKKNIIYISITGSEIELIEPSPFNSNTYSGGICGILNCDNDILSLGKIFKNPENLVDIDLPPICTEIITNAFEGCTNLTNIILPEDLQKIGEYAFKDCESFTKITIPEYVTTLGEGIFDGCKNIKSFEGKFVTYGGKAIVYNNILICVSPNDDSETGGRIYDISKIDKNITRLGNSCFSYCKELRRVNIPKNVTKIGKDIFNGCENLQEVHFYGETPPKIDDGCTLGINDNVKIFVPADYLGVYLNCFNGYNIYPRPNNGLIYFADEQYQTISDIKTEIPNKCFQGKTSITHVILSDNINKIGSEAFDSCVNLKYIYIPDSITNIGYKCFRNCTSLERIHIPYGTHSYKASFENNIFTGCTSLKEFGTYYKDYVSEDNRCYIQDGILKFFAQSSDSAEYKISNTNIHTIGEWAFESTNISRIELNDSIKTIAPYAFYGCKNLSKILNWDNVITISENAFNGCENLGNINNDSDSDSDISYITSLPERLKKIDKFAFSNCSNLNISEIPANVSYIGDYAFAGTGCESIDLSKTKITQINNSTFKYCVDLGEIVLSKNTASIGESAFEGCESLTTVNQFSSSQPVKYNLKTIGNLAFYGCKSLSYIPYYEVSHIGDYAFAGCYLNVNKNKEITLYYNIEHIGVGCFSKSGITTLTINGDAKKLTQISKSAFANCEKLTEVNISNANIISIDADAFNGCNKISTLSLPNSIKYIEDRAFFNCDEMKSITLPTSLMHLGDCCFSIDIDPQNPLSVKEIIVPKGLEQPPVFWKDGVVSRTSLPFNKMAVSITVPKNYYSHYLLNTFWSKYKLYIKEGEYILG